MYRHYVQVETLLFICYSWRSKFVRKIDMKIYFRYTLFRSPRCYFWCTTGTRYDCAPNFSCPVKLLFNFWSETSIKFCNSTWAIWYWKILKVFLTSYFFDFLSLWEESQINENGQGTFFCNKPRFQYLFYTFPKPAILVW